MLDGDGEMLAVSGVITRCFIFKKGHRSGSVWSPLEYAHAQVFGKHANQVELIALKSDVMHATHREGQKLFQLVGCGSYRDYVYTLRCLAS